MKETIQIGTVVKVRWTHNLIEHSTVTGISETTGAATMYHVSNEDGSISDLFIANGPKGLGIIDTLSPEAPGASATTTTSKTSPPQQSSTKKTLGKRKRKEITSSETIARVAELIQQEVLLPAMERTVIGLILAQDGPSSPLVQAYMQRISRGSQNRPPYVPSFFRSLDSGFSHFYAWITKQIPQDTIEGRVGKVIACVAVSQLDFDVWLRVFEDTRVTATLGRANPDIQTAAVVASLRNVYLELTQQHEAAQQETKKKIKMPVVTRKRYQCLAVEPTKSAPNSIVTIIEAAGTTIFRQPSLLDGDLCTFATAIADKKSTTKIYGIGPLTVLDIGRSLQLLGYLLTADVLPTRLSKKLGPFKTVSEFFKQVVRSSVDGTEGMAATVDDAERVIQYLRVNQMNAAQTCWGTVLVQKYGEEWTKAMSTLYFRNPTCLDVEMLLCESRKLLRARPKSYFDPQVEWSVVWRNKYKSDYNLSTMLVRVPLVHSSTNGGLSLSVVNLSAARKEGGSSSSSSP